jgi:hypothetical protein
MNIEDIPAENTLELSRDDAQVLVAGMTDGPLYDKIAVALDYAASAPAHPQYVLIRVG